MDYLVTAYSLTLQNKNSTVKTKSRLLPFLSAPLSLPVFDMSCHANCSRLAPPASSCHPLRSSPRLSDRRDGTGGHAHKGGQRSRVEPSREGLWGDLLVMTLPDSEARKPTLTSTRVMTRPLLCRCSVTNMRSPAAPWTKSEEKRHHRNTQYHISGREGETQNITNCSSSDSVIAAKILQRSTTTGK